MKSKFENLIGFFGLKTLIVLQDEMQVINIAMCDCSVTVKLKCFNICIQNESFSNKRNIL